MSTFRLLASKPSFWLLSFGAASASICGYGFGFWLPSLLNTNLGLSLSDIGSYFGSLVLIGGIAGIFLGGAIADKLGTARPGAYAAVPAVAFLLTGPLFAAAFYAESLELGWFLYLVPYALSLVWLGPIVNAVQNLVAPPLRATASACFLLINNLVGIGFGTFIFGFAADQLRPAYGDEALRLSLLYGCGFYLVASLLCGFAALRIRRDSHPGQA